MRPCVRRQPLSGPCTAAARARHTLDRLAAHGTIGGSEGLPGGRTAYSATRIPKRYPRQVAKTFSCATPSLTAASSADLNARNRATRRRSLLLGGRPRSPRALRRPLDHRDRWRPAIAVPPRRQSPAVDRHERERARGRPGESSPAKVLTLLPMATSRSRTPRPRSPKLRREIAGRLASSFAPSRRAGFRASIGGLGKESVGARRMGCRWRVPSRVGVRASVRPR